MKLLRQIICLLLALLTMAQAVAVPFPFAFWGASSDPSFSNVVLLLHFNGINAGTTLTDSSKSAHVVTAVGNAQLTTATNKFGSAAGHFDGVGDYLTLDGSSQFAFGTNDFTVEMWVYWRSVSSTQMLYDSRANGVGDSVSVTINTQGTALKLIVNNVTKIIGSTVLITSTWYHVALCRSGTSTKLFLNGTQEGSTYTDSNSYLNAASRPVIGAAGDGTGGGNLSAVLDDIRVTNPGARYTANFTPPTQQFADK